MPKTYYWAGNVINAGLRGVPYTPPTGSYVALYTASPTPAGGGVEVVGGGYSRQQAVWTAPVNGQSTNVADLVFPVASTSWGTIVAYGLVDAGLSGNLLYACAMARLVYARHPDPLPAAGDLEAQAELYKRVYNTAGGAATTAEYVANYKAAHP